MRRLVLAALVAASAAAGGARAEGPAPTLVVPLVQTAEPIKHSYPGRVLAVGGIELGMTIGEVRTKLATPGAFVQDSMERSPLRLTSQGITAVARPYVGEIESLRHDAVSNITLAVRFGLPSTGSRVVSIRSITVYTSAAAQPTLDTVLAQLRNAYGTASANEMVDGASSIATIPWIFSSKDQVLCPNQGCGLSDLALNGNDFLHSRDLVSEGKHIGLVAMLARSEGDAGPFTPSSRMHLVSIGLYDYANMALSVEQGMMQLQAAATATLDRRVEQDKHP